MKFAAVAFDVDGTLYPNFRMYLRSLPFAVRHYKLLRAFSKARKDLRRIRPIEDFQTLQAQLTGARLGLDTEAAREKISRLMYGKWEKVLHDVPLFPGAKDLLLRLKEAGVLLAVASDFPVSSKLGILGVDGLWDFELSTEDTNYLKPNPEPFLEIAKGLGIAPEAILYVGNSYEYDVLGAKNVGMAAAHLTRKPVKDSIADFSFSSFGQLAEFLFR